MQINISLYFVDTKYVCITIRGWANGTKKTKYITLEQMKNLGWKNIHCVYKVTGTGKDSPMSDMSSEIVRKHREVNQADIDKTNSLFQKYQIDSKERICAFLLNALLKLAMEIGFLKGQIQINIHLQIFQQEQKLIIGLTRIESMAQNIVEVERYS